MLKHVILTAITLFIITFGIAQDKGVLLSDAAIERTNHSVSYDGTYRQLSYPNGDLPDNVGVCTDVIIRSYRKALNIDFQKLIHEDMKKNFSKYPSKRIWGLTGPDKNIDHRRTQNMECFLKRIGAKQKISDDPVFYKPGDLIFWGDIASGHVGLVVNKKSTDGKRNLVVHNIGGGPQLEDFLFGSRITGHYRYLP